MVEPEHSCQSHITSVSRRAELVSIQIRVKRLQHLVNDPLTKVYLMFYQAVLPLFTTFNLFLQREDPCIHLVFDQMQAFLKKLLEKFIRVGVIRGASKNLSAIAYTERENQLDNGSLFVGLLTRGKLTKLVDEGDIDEPSRQRFFKSARQFYDKAISKALAKLPLADEVLANSRFLDFNFRSNDKCSFAMVEYFLSRYELNLGQQTSLNTNC